MSRPLPPSPPPHFQVTTAEEETAFAEALDKFADHLNNEKMKPDVDDPGEEQEEETPPVSFTLHRTFPVVSSATAAADDDADNDPAQAAAAAAGATAGAAAKTSARRRFPPFTGRGENKPDREEPVGAGKRRRGTRGGGGSGVEEAERQAGGGLSTASSGDGVEAKPASAAAADAAVRDDGPVVTRQVWVLYRVVSSCRSWLARVCMYG